MEKGLINPHVVCEVHRRIILKSHKNTLYGIIIRTCKEGHHITYINSKIISMGRHSRNTTCSTKSTIWFHSRNNQLQTTIFLLILWLLDKLCGYQDYLKLSFRERIIKNTFLIILVSLFLFSQKNWKRIIFNCCQKKMTKTIEKSLIFLFILTTKVFITWLDWLLPFQLVGSFYSITVKFFKNNNLIVYFLIC